MFEKLRGFFSLRPQTPEVHKIGFGPNRITIEVRRAKRDPVTNLSLKDEDGNVIYHEETEFQENWNVTCDAGLEAAKDRLFNSATSETVAYYIALSESNDTPAAGDTEVADEITLSGLARAAAVYGVGGCSTGECILSKTFTATESIAGVQLMGLLDAASTGDLYFYATFTTVALESDDQLTAKWDKITLS